VAFLFLNPEETDTNAILEAEFEKAAIHNIEEDLYSERILYVKFYYSLEYKDMLEMFMIKDDSLLPQVFMTWYHKKELLKYKMQQDGKKLNITKESILGFVEDFRNSRIKPFYMSEKEASDTKGGKKKSR